MATAVRDTPPSPTLTGPPRRARPLAAVLAAVGLPMFMVTLDNLVVTTALPGISEIR